MKRLLVIRLGALGDLVHLSAALNAIHQAQPDLEIHLLTRPGFVQLAQMIPSIHTVWPWSPQSGWKALWTMAQTLRQEGIEGVVNLHPSLKTWLLTRIIGRPTAVYKKEKLKVKGAAQRRLPRKHAVEDFFQPFLELPGLSIPLNSDPNFLIPRLSLQSDDKPTQDSGDDSLSQKNFVIGIIPGVGGKRANRAWPLENWVVFLHELNEHLHNKPLAILLFGGNDEQELAKNLISQLAPEVKAKIQNHCGRWDINGTARLMRQCDVVLGGDTGPLHLAAGLGVPAIGIFGPTSIARTGPRGTGPIVDNVPPESLACWPCELPKCPLIGSEHLACVRDITPAQIVASLLSLLGKQ